MNLHFKRNLAINILNLTSSFFILLLLYAYAINRGFACSAYKPSTACTHICLLLLNFTYLIISCITFKLLTFSLMGKRKIILNGSTCHYAPCRTFFLNDHPMENNHIHTDTSTRINQKSTYLLLPELAFLFNFNPDFLTQWRSLRTSRHHLFLHFYSYCDLCSIWHHINHIEINHDSWPLLFVTVTCFACKEKPTCCV